MSLDRRTFLRGLGLSAAALGLPQLRAPRARANGDIPQRIVFIYEKGGMMNGFVEPLPAPGAPRPTETAWRLNNLMEPLAPYQDRMIAFSGLDMVSDILDPTIAENAHASGQTQALTGAFRSGSLSAGGISINEFIARELNTPTPQTRLPSVEVAVIRPSSLRVGGSYSGPGPALPYLVTPTEVYDRLFPEDLRLSGEDAIRATQRREAVFDLIRGESDRLIADLSAEQRVKVQQHLDTRADLQRRLGLGAARIGNVAVPSFIDEWRSVNYAFNASPAEKASMWELMGRLNGGMVAAALHADITRVATISVHPAPDAAFGYAPGMFGSSDDHDLTHKVSGDRPSLTDPAAVEAIRLQHQRSTELLVSFLEELDSRVEPDGGTLLDHTLILWCGEIGNGSHDITRLPWVTIGDACGQLRTGRLLQFDRIHRRTGRVVPPEDWARFDQLGRPHNDLMVSLAQAMGIEIDTFGEPSVCTGRIDEMFR
ncbi:MAG: DUF1552 domain-containing protein [Sandaracinaceae bacterium]